MPKDRSGSAMSDKQLARTVLDGRILTFTTSTGDIVTGYLGGMDNYHWLVVTPQKEQVLVHKSAPKIKIGDKSYANEQYQDGLEKVIRPFRQNLQERGLIPTRSLSAVSATEGQSA